jgi:hypothetical protein
MVASRRIFIVSSSHPYHNCKIPFLYEHIMTPFMTPRRRRYLFLLSISSRASTSHIVFAPIMFALHSHSISFKVVTVPCHYRSSAISLLCLRPPSISQKVLYHPNTFRLLPPNTLGLFGCTLYIMYYQSCRLCLICTNTFLRYPGFSYYSAWTCLFFFIVLLWVVLVAFSGNNASLHFGIGVLSHCGLHL